MGLSNNTNRGKFINISKGKFVLQSGDTRTEYDSLSGVVTKITFEDDAFEFQGKKKKMRKAVFSIVDGPDSFTLKFDAGSGYGQQILKKLPNCDITRPIEITLTYDPTNKKSGAFIRQDGKSLPQKWTREKPGDMPNVEVLQVKGEDVYDGSKQNAWIEKYILENVASKCQAVEQQSHSEELHQTEEHEEAIPF